SIDTKSLDVNFLLGQLRTASNRWTRGDQAPARERTRNSDVRRSELHNPQDRRRQSRLASAWATLIGEPPGSPILNRRAPRAFFPQTPRKIRDRYIGCTNLGQLTRRTFGRSFAPKEGHAMTNATKKPPATVASDPQGLEHQIRQRAQELYEERGREDGHELDDWLRAEEEITGKKTRAVTA